MTEKATSKAGPVTLAVGLIIGGTVLLFYNFGVIAGLDWLWKLWPVLLIGVGLEYFIKRALGRWAPVHFHTASIILIILLIFAGGVFYATANAIKNFGGVENLIKGIPWHTASLTYSRSWESEPVEVKAGDQLIIHNKVGLVNLLPSAGSELSVRAFIRSPESGPAREAADRANPEVKRNGSQIIIDMPETVNYWGYAADLNIYVPSGVDVRVKSGTGRVTGENIKCNLAVSGNTGSVELKQVSGNIDVENKTGRVEMSEPGGNVRVKTGFGSVMVSSTRILNGIYELESDTGRVSLQLPKDSDLVIDARTHNGRISIGGLPEGGIARDRQPGESFKYTLGAGKGRVFLRTGTGAILINLRLRTEDGDRDS